MKSLKRSLDELFDKGILFLKRTKGCRTLLVHHKDADGLCSAAVLMRALEMLDLRPSKVIASSNEETKDLMGEIGGFDKVIVLDIDISYMKSDLDASGKDILLIDHHPPRQDLNGERIVYINPRLFQPDVYQPVSYIVFKMFSGIVNLGDAEWLAALGTIADLGFEDCVDLVGKFAKVEDKYELAKTVFWKDAERLDAYITEIGYEKALSTLMKLKSFEEFREEGEIKKAYKKFSDKYAEMEKIFFENAEEMKDIGLIISDLESDDRAMSSLLATNIALVRPRTIVVLMRKTGKLYAINARYEGEEIDLGKIMERSAKGLNGGGGHANAAGATINAENGEIFKERFVKELRALSGQMK